MEKKENWGVTSPITRADKEGYGVILRYALPEFITALLLYSLPFLLNAWFVAQLASTSRYAILGIITSLLHWLTKVAEALSVGTLVLVGQLNGRQEYERVGRVVASSFLITTVVGTIISVSIFFGSAVIYRWYGVPEKMVALGVPFLRMRAVSIFFMFIFLAFIGFLRGIKNTKTPMNIFIIGSVIFVIFDYVFIFGKWGFPALGLEGSALASVIQYAVMLILVIVTILYRKEYRVYAISLIGNCRRYAYISDLINVSWPVLIDKSVMALSYIWLCKMIAAMGKVGMATFAIVHDMERFALLPAIAFAQVITFLVSNDFGQENWERIGLNIKKTVTMALIGVFAILIVFSFYPGPIIRLFDQKDVFSDFAAFVFPILSILVVFDLLQLVLAGALRGAGDVRFVMITRVVVSICFFLPVSYLLSIAHIESYALKFIFVYGSFYVGNALMCVSYVKRFCGFAWQKGAI